MRAQQEQIFKMAKFFAVSDQTIKKALEEICYNVSHIMRCERVSIWLFNEDRSMLYSQNAYDAETDEHIVEDDLDCRIFSNYFSAIQSQRTLAVTDILDHPDTQEIARSFFETPQEYESLLDACIILSSGIGGLLCCESRERREWSSFDRMVVSSIADMLSFLFDRLSRLDFEENLQQLAYKDQLTGMDNYNAFLEKSEIVLSEMTEDVHGVFIYITIDQFIDIQSALGQVLTDEIIRIIADRFIRHFEGSYCISRIAFDHFIIFAPYDMEENQFLIKMQQLMKKLQEPVHVAQQEVYLTFSYGIAFFPEDVHTPLEGIQAARFALESSTNAGSRRSIGFYNADMHRDMKQQMTSQMNLRKGLEMNEFRLFYQPQVNCETGELIGFEALIRWQHPEMGLIYPGDFIELAESTGFIISIGKWVIREALAQLKYFKTQGMEHLTISINLSPRHFLQHGLPEFLQRCIEESGVDPKNLLLEITESVAMERHEEVQQRIQTLSQQGFNIAIDDFGTGYSAFIYLQTFPVKQLKIDRSFIMNVAHNDKSRAIVKAIIQLGRTLGIRTVAEGVETEEQWEILRRKGCDELQGFYFAKPLAEADMHRLLSRQELRLPM